MITLKHAKISYGNVVAVHDVSTNIGVGITGMLGPNGAGKTSTLEAIGTRLTLTGGELRLLGEAVGSKNLRKLRSHIGFLPQRFAYPKHFTALEFVRYNLWLRGHKSSRTKPLAHEALCSLGLEEQVNRRMKTLSGGMRQRVGIAAATAGTPRVILLDEPTVGLDPEQRTTFRQYLKELSQEAAIILSTHLAEDIQRVADHVLVMSEGQLHFNGTPGELSSHALDADEENVENGYARVVHNSRQKASS